MGTIRSFFLLLCLFLVQLAFAQNKSYEKVQIKKSVLAINSMKIINWSTQEFLAEAGPIERKKDGYNKTYTFDSQGIILFESMNDEKPSGTISEFQLYFAPPLEPNNVTPKDVFKKALRIDKLHVSRELTPAKMKNKLKKWKDTKSYQEHAYRMERDGMYIYFMFNDEETSLVKVSVGRVK